MKFPLYSPETSRASAVYYPLAGEPVIAKSREIARFGGPDTVLVGVDTEKTLGQPSGHWTLMIKSRDDFLSREVDDDWVDVSLQRYDTPYHVMRGPVDDCFLDEDASGGPTVQTYILTGRDHGKVFEETPIHYDFYTDGEIEGAAALEVLQRDDAIFGAPDKATTAILFGFISDLAEGDTAQPSGTIGPTGTTPRGRANWQLPTGMPLWQPPYSNVRSVNLSPQALLRSSNFNYRNFIQNCAIFQRGYSDDPARNGVINYNTLHPYGRGVWDLAIEWSDPSICEMYVDLIGRNATYLGNQQASTPASTGMAVIFRDRPFPTRSRRAGGVEEAILEGPYFQHISQFKVAQRDIVRRRPGKVGAERRNAFYASPQLIQELSPFFVKLQLPLWDTEDIRRHGLRKMDIITRYFSLLQANEQSVLGLAERYRERVRDFHCLNGHLRSGSFTLAHGRPDIRVGGRLLVMGDHDRVLESYYIESVRHSWRLLQGIKTTLGLTRGWIGDDKSLADALNNAISRYTRGSEAGYSEPETGPDTAEAGPSPEAPPPKSLSETPPEEAEA